MTTKVTPINIHSHFADYAETRTEYVPFKGHIPVQEQMNFNRAFGVVIVACVVFWVAVGYRIVLLVHRVAR